MKCSTLLTVSLCTCSYTASSASSAAICPGVGFFAALELFLEGFDLWLPLHSDMQRGMQNK